MLNVTETTKRLFGRTISDEEIELAKKDTEIVIKNKWCVKKYKKYMMDEEFPVIVYVVEKFAVTPDASYGWDVTHRGLHIAFRRERKYTEEGKLLKQRVHKKEISNHIYPVVDKFRVFNPPGIFFGKKVEEKEYSGIL